MKDKSTQNPNRTDEPLALCLLETKFPNAPIERFGVCYTGFVDRQTALKSFGQDLIAAAVGGLAGMILFGGKPDYYANIVIVGIQNKRLVLCELGYVPVKGTSLETVTVAYDNTSEALTLALKEPDKIECHSAALEDLEFSLSLEGKLSITGEIATDLRFVNCTDTKTITSVKEALLLFEGLGDFPKPKELLHQLRAGRLGFPLKDMKKAISAEGYVSILKGDFSDLPKEQQADLLSRYHDLPEPLQLFFINWFEEYHNRAPKVVLIAIATTCLTIVCLVNIVHGLMYHADEPSSLFDIVSFIFGIPGVIFSGVLWFAAAHNIRFRRWYKRLTINESRAHTVLIQER
ncbi:MAG: hypothetical protein JXM79_08590 [Sedimentisphaerales bacterium]|nr:hypothetical protein [Sedimentisphaerales bacterium]